MAANFLLIGIVSLFFILFFISFVFTRVYRRCPSNKVLAVQGWVSGGRTVSCYHGGAHLVWPLIQEARFLDLTPITINIPLKGALSLQNIRVNVPSTFTIAIDTNPDSMSNAAVRLLDFTRDETETMATEIILGQLRLTIASLTIEQINQDREMFLDAIRRNLAPELQKVGLALINVNITDITDESGYIESIGKKAASTAVNQAKIDVAQQERSGEIGKALADKERRIQVASLNAEAVEGENTAKARIASFNADLAQRSAEAQQRSVVSEQQAKAEIQIATALAEEKRLEAEKVVPREIEKRLTEINAEAEAQKQRKEAAGQADAIISVRTAEAAGILKILGAKSQGYAGLVQACNNNSRDASTMLIVEKLEDLVQMQTEAIKQIKIDKVTVWDSGNGEKGSATANFMSSMVKSLPPLHDVAGMAGIDLPRYLGSVESAVMPLQSLVAESEAPDKNLAP
jgi:flotillin